MRIISYNQHGDLVIISGADEYEYGGCTKHDYWALKRLLEHKYTGKAWALLDKLRLFSKNSILT